jgi:hypothetical protein
MGPEDTEPDTPSDSPWWNVGISDLRDWRLLVKVVLIVAALGVVLWLILQVFPTDDRDLVDVESELAVRSLGRRHAVAA